MKKALSYLIFEPVLRARLIKHAYSAALLLLSCCPTAFAGIGLQNLKCEMMVNPHGIGTAKPRLSWQITGDQRDIRQTAYQILVASSPELLSQGKADLWDSHKVLSDQSIMVSYTGKALTSRTACYWKVKTWTSKGESAWSAPAFWSEGLLSTTDWKAKWIGHDNGFPWDSVSKFSRLSARYLRKDFKAGKEIKNATVYIVGLGHYELYINGQIIGDQVLAEAPTDYTQSVLYNTFDVTENLKKGNNVIGAVLGNGRFFTMRPKYKPKKIKEFGFPKLLLQLEITFDDGTKQTLTSDESWKFTADGPIRTNNEYDGEEYDANKELSGWNKTGYDDAKWLKAEIVDGPGGKVEAQMNEPIKVVKTINPVAITPLKPGTWIIDMGQNSAGWLLMKVKGKQGDKVTLRYGETLQANGSLYVANLRDAKVTDIYTLKGVGEESWHPTFVFHGYRYVEVTGYPGTPQLKDFEGQVVSDAMENTGSFTTSNSLINHIYQNAWWGILSDYKGMPVDCPQRNERMPWLGDRALGSLGESFVFNNRNLYAKWMDDIEQSQKPDGSIPDVAPAYWNYYSDNMTWPGTYILINDMLYNQFGDKVTFEKHYASMKKWLTYMRQKYLKNDLMTKDKYGDWCVPPESPELIHTKDSSRNTSGELIATAYYYHLMTLMQRFAKIMNKPQDVQEYAALELKAKNAFNRKFLDRKTWKYDNNTVTANLLPLYFGMVPAGNDERVFDNIVDKIKEGNTHISTGVIGTQWLMRGLTSYGRPDLAYKIAGNDDYPSWGYMVKRGATTIWELWNGDTANPAMNSHNHIMLLGDLITWFYQDLAGIKAKEPAFKTIEMKAAMTVSGLDSVNTSYQTPYGQVKSSWKKQPGQLEWNISVPPNSKAIVYLPAANAGGIKESGKAIQANAGIKYLSETKGNVIVEIGSGDYDFKLKN